MICDHPIVHELCNVGVSVLYVCPCSGYRVITHVELSAEHFTENFKGPSVLVLHIWPEGLSGLLGQ